MRSSFASIWPMLQCLPTTGNIWLLQKLPITCYHLLQLSIQNVICIDLDDPLLWSATSEWSVLPELLEHLRCELQLPRSAEPMVAPLSLQSDVPGLWAVPRPKLAATWKASGEPRPFLSTDLQGLLHQKGCNKDDMPTCHSFGGPPVAKCLVVPVICPHLDAFGEAIVEGGIQAIGCCTLVFQEDEVLRFMVVPGTPTNCSKKRDSWLLSDATSTQVLLKNVLIPNVPIAQ